MEKRCSCCKQNKEVGQFFKEKAKPDGYSNYCKECTSIRGKVRYREKYPLKDGTRSLFSLREWHLKTKYNITEDQYNNMLQEQSNRCLICNSESNAESKKFAVDHCHKTGKVRGLLCSECNSGIGFLKENPDIMLSAIEYLKKHN